MDIGGPRQSPWVGILPEDRRHSKVARVPRSFRRPPSDRGYAALPRVRALKPLVSAGVECCGGTILSTRFIVLSETSNARAHRPDALTIGQISGVGRIPARMNAGGNEPRWLSAKERATGYPANNSTSWKLDNLL